MNQLVSIVVPAYNAAKRIEPTLLSLAAQDYANIEIIVVDDGSSDGTSELAAKVLLASGRNFKIVKHDANKGLPAARNSGLSVASGDYAIFFDADDLADGNFVSVLLNAIAENDSDAAFCGYRTRAEVSGEEHEIPVGLDPSHKYSAEDLAVMYIFAQVGLGIWTTIFKTNFLRTAGLKFNESFRAGEDREFLMRTFARCGSIGFSAGYHYIYIQHEDQMSKIFREKQDKGRLRYKLAADILCSAARYMAEYSNSLKLREIARNFMLPEGLIKTMNVAAQDCDKEKFYRTLREPETRQALKACFRNLLRKPELVFKAMALLTVPGLYYLIRSKPRKQA